ncbi:MAG: copper-containing nitrite reductase [Thermoplasmata archaeon]
MAAAESESPTARTWLTVFLGAFLIAAAGGAAFGFLAGRLGTPPAPSGVVNFELRAFLSGYVGVGGPIDDVTNPVLEVDMGDTVTITVTNGESLEHDLAVEGYDVQTQRLMGSGLSDSITFVADEAGSFAYYCTVPGHRELGMEGLLIVGGGTGPSGPGPALPVDVPDIAKDATDLPPPIVRNVTATVHIFMEVREVVAEIEPGATFRYWTFNGTVPGPFFRVRLGDTVVVHFRNNETSTQNHSVDFHAVTGPGGGAVATQTPPGQETSFQFKALNAGIFIYHCASGHIPSHIAMGMYGMILVEPTGGLPAVDREFYVVQGEFYSKYRPGTPGHHEFDGEKMRYEDPEYVVFNGRFQALTGDQALKANTNETVRIFFGNAGPNLISSFHVIGEIFDRVYTMGDLLSPPALSVQTTPALPGGATAVELKLEVPARYLLVDHAISRTIDKGALGFLEVEGPENPDVYQAP